MNQQTPVVSEAVLARVMKKAKRKGAETWEVRGPIEDLSDADQVTALAYLFESGGLGAKHQVGLDAMARALTFMEMGSDDALPRGLTGAATKLLSSLKTAPPDAPGMFPGYSHSLDMIVMWAYALDRAPLEALVVALEGPARWGLESVRFRFGQSVPAALQKTLLEGFARTDGDHLTKWHTLISTPDGLEGADDDELEALALRLGERSAWHDALAAAAGKTRPFRAWLVPRLDAAQVVETIGSLPEDKINGLDADTIGALLAHPSSAQAFSDALPRVPDTVKAGKTLLGIVIGAKLAAASLPIPRPWPLFRSYDNWSAPIAKRLLAGALLRIHEAFPADRSHAYVNTALPSRFPDVMVALAAHPEPALVELVLETFSMTAHPEARGMLLARLGKPMPHGRQQRLDYLVARCEAVAEDKRDPRWLEALDLREDIDSTEIWPAVWAESRILLAFSAAQRAAVVLPALRGDGPKGHAIQLLHVLDEADASAGLAAALTSPEPPPSNWLSHVLRLGSLPGVAAPWTHDTLLARLDPAARARYAEVMGHVPAAAASEAPAPAAAEESSALEALRKLASGPERIYALVRADETSERRAGSCSCLGGNGPVAPAHVPKKGKTPMDHVITIDLADVAEWRARWPEAAAISVFMHDVDNHDGDFSKARVVWVPEGGVSEPDGTSVRIVVVPVDVPEGCFDKRDEPGEVRDAIGRLGGYAQGAPLWIQHDETPTKRKKAAGFLFQINHALAQSHLNLGDGGSLFVFDDGTVVFQCH